MNKIAQITNSIDINKVIEKPIKIDQNSTLKQAAEEFESLFINEMLKRAHKAKLANSILSSEAQDTYTSMLNQERSKHFAKTHNFGIAEALVKQFSKRDEVYDASIKKSKKE